MSTLDSLGELAKKCVGTVRVEPPCCPLPIGRTRRGTRLINAIYIRCLNYIYAELKVKVRALDGLCMARGNERPTAVHSGRWCRVFLLTQLCQHRVPSTGRQSARSGWASIVVMVETIYNLTRNGLLKAMNKHIGLSVDRFEDRTFACMHGFGVYSHHRAEDAA